MIVHEIQSMPAAGPPDPPANEKWVREKRAFYRLLGGLLEQHRGQYAAIHNEQVVGIGPDLVEVAMRAYAAYGRQPIYVDLVEDHPLAPIRFPHYREPTGSA